MILVTGAGGFIGRQVCQLLSDNHEEVLAVDRKFDRPLSCPGLQTQTGDLRDPAFFSNVLERDSIGAIVHLAGMLNTASQQHPLEAMEVNIGCSLRLLELAIQSRVPKFVFGSSISVYGPRPYAEYGEVSESEPAAPSNIYGVGKRYVEIAGEHYAQEGKINFTALRISMVVGPGAASIASRWRSEIFERLATEEQTEIHIPFLEEEFLPLIYVADLAITFKYLLDARETLHTVYNTPSENVRGADLARCLRSVNPNIKLVFDASRLRGDPEAIDGSRFTGELPYHAMPLEQRLREFMPPER